MYLCDSATSSSKCGYGPRLVTVPRTNHLFGLCGRLLLDSRGVPLLTVLAPSVFCFVFSSFFFSFLSFSGLAPAIPEDLYYMIKKAVNVRRHLERNRKDKDSKFRLILVEVRIYFLSRLFAWRIPHLTLP